MPSNWSGTKSPTRSPARTRLVRRPSESGRSVRPPGSAGQGVGRPHRLVEPDAAMVAEARETVDQAFKQLEPLL